MDCGNVRNLLPYLDDGEMDENIAAAIRAHLERCDDCRHDYEEQRSALSLFERAYRDGPDMNGYDFIDGVTARIERRRSAKRSLHRYAAVAVIIMAVGTAILIKLGPITGGNPETDVTVEVDNPELESYVAAQYMNTDDLQAMLASLESDTEEEIIGTMITDHIIDLTAEEFIQTLDDNEIAMLYASLE